MLTTPPLACRACGRPTEEILNLGQSPLANQLRDTPDQQIDTYPLGLIQCGGCGLVQNATCLPTQALFTASYPYLSSVSSAVCANARDLASQIVRHTGTDIIALDIGSNDGATQVAFRDVGVDCFGVDPAPVAVAQARLKGCKAHCGPFDQAACDVVLERVGKVDVVTMSNVLAHVPSPGDLLASAVDVLTDDGLLVIEVQSWLDLVAVGGFDMVYHEHHAHFSLSALMPLVQRYGFGVIHVDATTAQGGSLRVWCRKGHDHSDTVSDQSNGEQDALALAPERLRASVQSCRQSAAAFAADNAGRAIAGYGAAAKTVTLLAACGAAPGITQIADNARSKIGKFLPVGALPIVSVDQMLATGPDAIVLFAWNLADEILPTLQGHEVWVPMPTFRRIQ